MSFPAKCSACWSGDHAHHIERQPTLSVLIGGTHCPCPGDCVPIEPQEFSRRWPPLPGQQDKNTVT